MRVSGSTEWQRLWVVVSLLTPSNISVDMGRPSSPSSSMKKNRMSGFFGGKSSNASSSALQVPTIAMYPSNKAKDKKRMMYTATRVTQAFAVYPERPEVITQSTLFKVEATVKDEAAYSSTVHRGDPHEGYILMIPEVEPGRPGSTEMLRWLVGESNSIFHILFSPLWQLSTTPLNCMDVQRSILGNPVIHARCSLLIHMALSEM